MIVINKQFIEPLGHQLQKFWQIVNETNKNYFSFFKLRNFTVFQQFQNKKSLFL